MACEDIPSLLDLQNNKKNIDDLGRLMGKGTGTSTNGVTGQVRPTYNAVMSNLGYTRVGTFASGATLLNGRQTLLWDVADGGDGQEYGWSGVFPPSGKLVPPGSTPLTTGGIAVGAWMSRFDPELRTQVLEALRRSYAEAGYNVVGTFGGGFTIVNSNDVGIDESTGNGFTGPVGVVAAGTDPTSGGFVDRAAFVGDVTFSDVAEMQSMAQWLGAMPDGVRVSVKSYFSDDGGGGFDGVLATGAHTNNGGSVHSLSDTRYVSVTDTFTLCDPRAWGVRAKAGIDDHAAWTAMMVWYKTKIKVKTVTGQSPTYTAPFIRGVDGTSELSDKLLFPDFLAGDLSKAGFKRHSSWSAPTGTYLLGFNELYQADFGGVTISQEDYVFEIYNANLDKGLIELSGVHNALNDNFMKVEVQSSSFVYSNFRSDNCKHFLDLIRCDHMKLKDGWITQGTLTTVGDATIKVGRAYLSIENVVGVPAADNAAKCAWVNNNNGRVKIDEFRAGGENSGCTLVNNYALNRTITDVDPTPVGVTVQNSECYSADTQSGLQKSCVIRLFELPNFIIYENNEGHQLTQEVISWDSGVIGKQAKINTLLSKRTGFNFSYNDILEYNAVQPYDDSLACLFGRTLRVPLGYTVATSGQVFCETRLRPRNGQVYRLTVKANPAAGGSSEYRSVVTADIHIVTGLSGGNAVRRVIVANLTQTPGGGTFASNINISVGFWNGTAKTQDAVVNSDDHRLYVDVTGLQSGQETSFISGYIEQIL